MRLRTRARMGTSLPTAALANLALLLGIFLLITTVHEVDRTSVSLPRAVHRVAAEVGSPVVVLLERAEGEVVYRFSNGREMSREVGSLREVYLEASRLTAREAHLQFVVRAPGAVRFEKIDELLDALREARVERLLLDTDPKSGGRG